MFISVRTLLAAAWLAGGLALAQTPDSTRAIGPDTSPAQVEDRTVELSPSLAPQPRIMIMPTANPIGAGKGFITNTELLFYYGGVGIGDYLSLTAGISTLPIGNLSAQLITSQLKVSVADAGLFNLALGFSASQFTSTYFYSHLFVNTTLLYDTTWWITAMLYYRTSGADLVDIQRGKFASFSFPYTYPFGFAIGFETRPSGIANTRFIGEFWFAQGMASLVGVRFGNDLMESTFGFVTATQLLPLPVMSFGWRW